MKLFGFDITRNRTPIYSYVIPGTNLINSVYTDDSEDSGKLFTNIRDFIAKEFTKITINVDRNLPNHDTIDYMLNLKPNESIIANELLFNFAYGMLKYGYCYYKLDKSTKSYNSFDIQYTLSKSMKGYTKFSVPYLKLREPKNLLSKYDDLLTSLSTSHSSNVIEIKSQMKSSDIHDPNMSDTEKQARMATMINQRLVNAKKQMQSYGLFTTQQNENTADHINMVQPDGTALSDLKSLIYEHLNISGKLLDGTYSESDYRAFWATQLQPLASVFATLLNILFVNRSEFAAKHRIKVIMNLMQFSTLSSFESVATHALYYGYMKSNEIRENLGLDPYEGPYGEVIFSNANAVPVNYKSDENHNIIFPSTDGTDDTDDDLSPDLPDNNDVDNDV